MGIVSEGAHLEARMNPVRYEGEAQDEHEGPEGAGPPRRLRNAHAGVRI